MMRSILIGMTVLSGSVAQAAVIEVHVGSYYLEPQFPAVEVGDTIRWIWDGGNHDVTSGAFCGDDTGLFYAPITSSNQTYEWTVPAAFDGDVIPYYCSVGNHCVAGNQYGGLLVNVGSTHFVSSNGFAFEPASIEAEAGDVVIWIHDGGSHTVTSGADCVADGRFDEALDNLNQMPYFVIPTDEPTGVIDYYCVPHCGMGMTATIAVEGTSGGCSEDIDGSGSIDVNDLLALLAAYGQSCSGCSEDVDGSGQVSVDDLLMVLAVFGSDC